MADKSKKPTGLKLSRDGNKFKTGWTIPNGGYGDGQQWQYALTTVSSVSSTATDGSGSGSSVSGTSSASMSWKHYPDASDSDIGKAKTEKNISITLSDYYPNSKKYLTAFSFRVRGNKAKSGKENLGWSDWNDKTFTLSKPSKPTISTDTTNNKTKFSWSVSTSDTSNKPFRRVSLYTALKQGFNADPKTNTDWTLITTNTTHEGATISDKSGYSSSLGGWQASGYIEFTESTSKIDGGNWTRMVKVVAQGCAGESVAYDYHVYGASSEATQTDSKVNETSGGYSIKVSWQAALDKSMPIDEIVVQWVIATPNSDMSCPSGVSWQDGRTVLPTDGLDSITLTIDARVGDDECLYTRVNTYHDGLPTYGAAILQVTGKLSNPTITVGTVTRESQTAQITIAHQFVVSGTKVAIIYDKNGSQTIVGLASAAGTSTVKCPAWDSEDTVQFGAKAVLPKTTSSHTDDGVTIYDIDSYMESDLVMQSGTVAVAPSNVSLARDNEDVRVSWQNNWDDATGIELSWSDNPFAWESTDQPDTFSIDNPYVTNWRIAGLKTGQAWYVKVRAYVDGDTKAYSPFSPVAAINLSSSPSTPTLALSRGIVPIGDVVTASWEYASTDGTAQDEARIYRYAIPDAEEYSTSETYAVGDYAWHSNALYRCTTAITTAEAWTAAHWVAVPLNSEELYTLIATTTTQEYIDLKFATAGSYQLCVEVVSASGQRSVKSSLINLTVATPLSCSMVNSLTDVTVIDDDGDEVTIHALTVLPLTATVTGAGTGGTTSLTITRTVAYHLERPDESELDGFLGETVLSYTQTGNEQISIGYSDLIGSLDDGGDYRLTATVTDNIGQKAECYEDFTVLWSHQALTPEGEVVIDKDSYSAILYPIAPTGTTQTDVCDIYRLSSDKPVLVYRGATFGEKYVDPYPAIGENGGYRFVFRTADGDYTTEEGTLAFYDCYDDVLDLKKSIINFGGEMIELQYNLEVSHQWDKDFVSEKFLDGSIKGYWKSGVSRNGNMSNVSIPILEEGIISALRRLSEYEGRCYLRTPDGSSFPADIQVSESWNPDKQWTMADFQFNITRTDEVEPAGIEYTDWERQ